MPPAAENVRAYGLQHPGGGRDIKQVRHQAQAVIDRHLCFFEGNRAEEGSPIELAGVIAQGEQQIGQ